ncbi:MAG: N-formylglutamate amidohydrolase [Gammaproteobacteria bacterium]
MTRWLLSCEHGGNQVPERWRHLFRDADTVLESHRGWDRGSLDMFRALEAEIADAAYSAHVTRLLVDLNRSVGHRHLFSSYSRDLAPAEKQQILEQYYLPWRMAVADRISGWRQDRHAVLHVSVHSFTPELDGHRRNADIGLLYDPGRPLERELSRCWRGLLADLAPDIRVRMNYPYRGTADGFTRWLRASNPSGYAGIELELNEGSIARRAAEITAAVLASMRRLRSEFDPATVPAS